MGRSRLTPRNESQSKWYSEVVEQSGLAEHSPVRGCMVIKPYGYAIWEAIQQDLDGRIKKAGVKNAYFPLFVPKSFLSREAEHVKGFAKECAIVTHYRLRECSDGSGVEVDPEAKLEEELIIRPTSETIIYDAFSRWVKSWRDLPLLINQWANVVRWEKRTRPFLRTSEFLWQEGHTAHATEEDAAIEVRRALQMYHDFAKETLALPTQMGLKTRKESFPGADYTTSIEALLKDGKALQAGTSHMLGRNFSRSFEVKYLGKDNKEHYVWQTSWGMSTRILGAMILMHGDDKGLVLPPRVAPIQVIIIPIFRNNREESLVRDFVDNVNNALGGQLRVEADWRDETPGWKFSEWEMKGVPLRLEIGPRDVMDGSVSIALRNTGVKMTLKLSDDFSQKVKQILNRIQMEIYESALEFVEENTHEVISYEDLVKTSKEQVGFIKAYFCGDEKEEELIKSETGLTTRCIPFETIEKHGKCLKCGGEGKLTYFAKAY